jgi:glycerol uptake facilitator-like aquaporin
MEKNHAQAWLSEFAGTTILLFVSVLVARWLVGPGSALASAVPGVASRAAIDAVIIGATVGLLIISPFGRSSGGHFNPAVTVTMSLLRALPRGDAGAYIVAQLAGSVAGVLLGRAVLGAVMASPAVRYAAIQPAGRWPGGAVFAGEAISFVILMAVVVAVLVRPAVARWSPAVVAAGVAVLIFVGALTSGGSFNPARQLLPLLLAGRLTYLWAYLLGPIAGAVILATFINAVGLPRPLSCSLCPSLSGPPPKPILHNWTRHEQEPRRAPPRTHRDTTRSRR